jgi:hypothetical protein
LDGLGMAAVAGITNGSFPTTPGAFDVSAGGGGQNDGFVSVLDIGAGSTTAVEGTVVPALHMAGPYPNPFSGQSSLSFTLDNPVALSVRVYDVSGRMVRELARSTASGFTRYTWDGRDATGRQLPSGIYYMEVRLVNQPAVRRSVVILR